MASLTKDNTDGAGDCYDTAAAFVVEASDPNTVLCHGTALGTGGEALGLRYGHAWVEVEVAGEWLVIDRANGFDYLGRRDRYYAAGTIREVKRYPKALAMQMLLQRRHYGPWR